MDSNRDSTTNGGVRLSEKEQAVMRNALGYYLDEVADDDPSVTPEIRAELESNYESVQNGEPVSKFDGMMEMYRTVFRDYASELETTIETEAEGETMQAFFEPVFKNIAKKFS